MINKFKNIARRGISLLLALGMMVPTCAYGAADNIWDDYKKQLKDGIMGQKESIIINFNISETFTSEYNARLKISEKYNEVIEDIPKYFGELNIKSESTVPMLNEKSKGNLKSVTHTIGYNNSASDIAAIKTILNEEYKTIRTLVTDYEKIKAAYDYVIDALKYESGFTNNNILNGLKGETNVSSYVYAMLFSMMMDELGYENHIVEGTVKVDKEHTWNLVKIQGNWYHVDTKYGDVYGDSGLNKDKYLLTSDDILNPTTPKDTNMHIWEGIYPKAENKYEIDKNLEYEIKLIKAEIEKISDEIVSISEEISMEKIIETKNRFEVISKKVKSHEEMKDILKPKVENSGDVLLSGVFDETFGEGSESSLGKVKEKINKKKATIVNKAVDKVKETLAISDILTAKEAAGMLANKTIESKMIVLQEAVEAIEKAEQTRIQVDVNTASTEVIKINIVGLKEVLQERIAVIQAEIKAIAAVEAAEGILIAENLEGDNEVNNAVDSAVNSVNKVGEGANAVVAKLDDDSAIKKELLNRIAEIDKVILAKGNIVDAEDTGGATKVNIDIAKNAIDQISTKYSNIKKNLENRIIILESKLKKTEAKEAVDSIETNILKILSSEPVYSLETIRMDSEAAVKTAETEVKKIKDTTAKTGQRNRIKYLKIIIAAIKAVEKVELIPKATNVTTSRKAIVKIEEATFLTKIANESVIIGKLNSIVDAEDEKIKASEAEKLVEKAEVSLKDVDYEKARGAVDKILNTDLTNRVTDNLDVISAKKAVENAEKLMKANKGTVEEYNTEVVKARTAYKVIYYKANELIDGHIDYVDYNEYYKEVEDERNNYIDKYGDFITNFASRIEDMEDAIVAINKVNNVEIIYKNYIDDPKAENKKLLDNAIDHVSSGAKVLIAEIDDTNANLKGIKKSLQSRLKTITDKLIAEGSFNEISNRLKAIEIDFILQELAQSDAVLETEITNLENRIASIESDAKTLKSSILNDRITAIKNVLAATKAVVVVENSDESTITKNIKTAETAVKKLSATGIYKEIKSETDSKFMNVGDFKTDLQDRIDKKKAKVESSTNEAKAKIAVDKAIASKKESDIKAAIDAVAKLTDKKGLDNLIKIKIIDKLRYDANTAITIAISSIERNDKAVSQNVTEAKRLVTLVNNVVSYADIKLGTTYKDEYKDDLDEQDESILVIETSVEALKVVAQAVKSYKQVDVDMANSIIARIPPIEPADPEEPVYPEESKYSDMKDSLKARIKVVQDYLDGEVTKETAADNLIIAIEEVMDKYPVDKELLSSKDIRDAQEAVDRVTDKTNKSKLQKRLDNLNLSIAAISSVTMAEAYIDTTTVKAAEKALNDLVKSKSYSGIAENLSARIGELKNQLNIKQLVEDATKLVQKAVESRKMPDSVNARVAVEGIREYVYDENEVEPDDLTNPYLNLKNILDNLDLSIKNEASDEFSAVTLARDSIDAAVAIITGGPGVDGGPGVVGVNVDIQKIINPASEEGATAIIAAYGRIQEAKNHIITANAAVKKLTDQKDLLLEIKGANNEIELAEDNLDVKEAIRLVTIASNVVMSATTEEAKALAKLDISKARLAINKIGRSENKDQKATVTNMINAIEAKLTSDNDQHLIDNAVAAVNAAADALADALSVSEDEVKSKRKEIDQSIFAARLAISWISENNKSAKDTLTVFIDGIDASFKAVIDGVENSVRIKSAEDDVEAAEKYEGINKDEKNGLIMAARIKVSIIQNLNADTKAKIDELNLRLDILEGKTGGTPGTDGGSGSGGSGGGSGNGSGGNNPGGNNSGNSNGASPIGGSSGGNIIITTPLPDRDREKGPKDPKWGKTKELKKANPSTN